MGDLVKCRQPTPFSRLYADYVARCATDGVEAKSKRAHGVALEKSGFAKSKG